MPKIKALIFDFDGTIADTLPLCISAFRQSIAPLIGRELSDQDIIDTFGPSEEGTVMALAPDHYDTGIENYIHYYQEMHHKFSRPFDGIDTLLKSLKAREVPIALVTGKGLLSTKISLQFLQLEDYFSIVETGSPLGPRKTEAILDVLKIWRTIKNSEVIYVGDAPSDIIHCRNANVKIASVAWAATSDVEALSALNPDYLFNRVEDFSRWVLENI